MKMVLTQGEGSVELELDKRSGNYYRGKVIFRGHSYLEVGYIMNEKVIYSSTCLGNFEDSKLVVCLMKELISVFDSQPSIETLKRLGYKEIYRM